MSSRLKGINNVSNQVGLQHSSAANVRSACQLSVESTYPRTPYLPFFDNELQGHPACTWALDSGTGYKNAVL